MLSRLGLVLVLLLVTFLEERRGGGRADDTSQPEDVTEEKLKEDLDRIFDENEKYESEARFFNFDRERAFNTSVAFTIPLFSFTLPGSAESISSLQDYEGNVLGVLSFVALFLMGGLGIAIYTTSQGPNVDSQFNSRRMTESYIMNRIYDAIYELPRAIDAESCANLAVCDAHADPGRYGMIGTLLRMLHPVDKKKELTDLGSYERAAKYGSEGKDECYYEYPCLVQPLDLIVYMKNYFLKTR